MYRLIYNDLIEWKKKFNRKPLLMQGARQVGKTYILKEFGKSILCSQRAIPDKLLKNGFNFQYPDIEDAIRNVL